MAWTAVERTSFAEMPGVLGAQNEPLACLCGGCRVLSGGSGALSAVFCACVSDDGCVG